MKKNKEWALIELGKLFPSHAEMYDYPDNITVMKCELLNKVYDILKQLDEPEVLLQELPVIPKFVAERIEKSKENNLELGEAFSHVFNALELVTNPTKELFWIKNNQELFARAWLDGFTVEEEQKYYVDLDTAAYVAKWDGNDQVGIYTDGISGSDEFEFHLTEQEIKGYDKRFWPFAMEVGELEE